MRSRDELQRKIDRKLQENKEMELKIMQNNAYIQGIQESLRFLGKEPTGRSGERAKVQIKSGSAVAVIREILRKAGKPLHVNDILKEMGRPLTRNSKAAISGTLSPYVRDRNIFCRPAPNTFALIGTAEGGNEPPNTFGMDEDSPSPHREAESMQ